jgi:hypothetical protein
MSMEEEEFTPYGAFSSGCDIHGEDFLRECTMCGIEFCSACFPQSRLCSDCAAQGDIGDDAEEPTEEEKDLKLLEGFNDDEHDPETEEKEARFPAPPAKKSAPAPKAKEKAPAKKPAPKAKAQAKAKAKPPAPKAKVAKKAKAAPKAKTKTKAKPKAKAKKPAPKKRKG